MKLHTRLSSFFAAAFAAVTLTVSANATLTAIGPFTGTYSETFEGFSNYVSGPFYRANGEAIMGGFATMSASNSDLIIYQPGSADFGLSNALASVSDGVKGLGLNSRSDTVTFAFSGGVTSFGGYFGAAYGGGWSGLLGFNFSDGSTASYTYNGPGGTLAWQGWSSTVDISSVSISGDYIVMDGLQANSNVPDSGATLALLGGAIVGLAALRRRFAA